MNIQIIAVGKIKEKYLQQGIEEYRKCIQRYHAMDIVEVADERAPENLSPAQRRVVKIREGVRIRNAIRRHSFVITLAIEGQTLSTGEFSKKLNNLSMNGINNIDFLIGGSLGLDEETLKRADLLLSFSNFTFPHQLMRLMLVEQIYRVTG